MVITAFALFAFIPLMAFAIDVPHWFDYSRNLQNRADAAALAAGDQLGNMCAANPTSATTSPENSVGEMAQLYSGPQGSSADLPYGYSGSQSPLDAAGPLAPYWTGQPGVTPAYVNLPSLPVASGTNGADYHVLLNADNYATGTPAGTNFAIGDFCHGNPTLDRTDKECFGLTQSQLRGQLALDCATGAMVDVKVTQAHVPQWVPWFNSRPNISAHARVAAQGIGEANNLKPLGVEDAGVTPCVRVTFFPTSGASAPQTVQLSENTTQTGSTGPIYWDNSGHNAGTGDQITIPTGANLYMQTQLYAPGASGTCSTLGNPLTYEQNSGILMLNSYSTTLPTSGQPPHLIGNSSGGGVTLLNNGTSCSHDQYFSNNPSGGTSCGVTVCAIVAFTPDSVANQQDVTVTVGGAKKATDMHVSTDPNCATSITGATAWESPAVTIGSSSGQTQFRLGWTERSVSQCGAKGNSTCSGTFDNGAAEQQAFAACNEAADSTCGGDPNHSGPIIQAYLTNSGTGFSTVGAYPAGAQPHLIIHLALQGLQDSPRTDRCASGPTQCTLLRFDTGNADGMVDCGEGNGASSGRLLMLYGCPLAGQTATAANPVSCQHAAYCGGWMPVPVGTPDGVCNNATRIGSAPVDCVNTNNQGQTMPACIQALVVAAGGNNGVVDYSKISTSNCHVTGSTCSEDKWLDGKPIVPGVTEDPRIITTFIVYQGDLSGATGNQDMQIRTFASFYVTGWTFNGGNLVNCGTFNPVTNPGGNEPAPSTLPNTANAIWGHWITYTEPGAGGNGQPCNFNGFGDCAVVLTR